MEREAETDTDTDTDTETEIEFHIKTGAGDSGKERSCGLSIVYFKSKAHWQHLACCSDTGSSWMILATQ
jgi:hypothetical protein